MPDNKIKIDSATIENWNYYLKLHSTGSDYRTLKARELELEFQKLMKDYEKLMQPVYDAYAAISPHYIGTVGPTYDRIIEEPKYRAIAYDEILKCIVYREGDKVRWKDPIYEDEYEKIGDKFVKAGQFAFENFFKETFYQYAVTKAITSGQSLKDKERLLKRQVSHNTRVGKKAPLTKYNMVKGARGIATKQGGYVTKFLEYYNKPYIALPLAAWTNVFSANGVYYPEETDFRNRVKALISQYLDRTLPQKSRFPQLDKEIKKQTNPEKND